MDERPRPDVRPVYHERTPEDPHTGGLEGLRSLVQVGIGDPPRRFALCAEEIAEPDDPDEEEPEESLEPEIVGWGLEFPDEAVVYLRDPFTGRRIQGIFRSAERARSFYSRFGELRLEYA